MAGPDPFLVAALETNRRGALTDAQRANFAARAASDHRSAFGTAGLLAAGAAIVFVFASPTSSPAWRALLIAGGAVLAVIVAVRAATGADALTRDLREGRVAFVDGAVGKRRISPAGRSVTHYLLDVGRERFTVSWRTAGLVPDNGHVRLYFLPRSRIFVNVEALADAPVPSQITIANVLPTVRASFLAPTVEQRNEARAELGAMGRAVEASWSGPPPVVGAADARPLAEAIVGHWTSPLISATFEADGRLTLRLFAQTRTGHWSVDASGRLHSDVMGRDGATDAAVSGHQLTIAYEGRNLTLTRES